MLDYLEKLTESDEFKQAMGYLVDYAIAKELMESRDRMIDDYEAVKYGCSRNIFVFNDDKKDAKELKKRIKAYDLVLDMYTVGHVFYDFKQENDLA